jgi:hypothetical protein
MSGLLASLVVIGCAIGFLVLLTAIAGLAVDGLYRFQEGP